MAVTRLQQGLPRKTKIGHAGTLDPMATGVLVVAVGPATRLISYAQAATKKYVGTFKLGHTSDTEDIEGEVTQLADSPIPTLPQFQSAAEEFIGEIEQTPPQYSAVKVNGQRAYRLARAGKVADIAPRKTLIHAVELVEYKYPDFTLAIECGKGTYVRTLARDIAKSVGSDSVMTGLCRTAVGAFRIEESVSLEEAAAGPMDLFRPPNELVADVPQLLCDDEIVKELTFGRKLTLDRDEPELAAVDGSGQLLAILQKSEAAIYKPKINFAPLHAM